MSFCCGVSVLLCEQHHEEFAGGFCGRRVRDEVVAVRKFASRVILKDTCAAFFAAAIAAGVDTVSSAVSGLKFIHKVYFRGTTSDILNEHDFATCFISSLQ